MTVSIATALLLAGVAIAAGAGAAAPPEDAFERTWKRTDGPVADGLAHRTWMWGPRESAIQKTERYVESTGGERTVMYFDKSRMEITHPDAVDDGLWYVTNGLLVVELVTGQMQTGDTTFEPRQPAEVNVAGDPDDPTGPTYATFRHVLDETPIPPSWHIIQTIDRAGVIATDPSLGAYEVRAVDVGAPTNHAVASPFWTFMQSSGLAHEDGGYREAPLFPNPFYATGYPITEAYWADVTVAGQRALVLIQCFERRCLTWTPSNPAGWQVEAGNVGQHYYRWRYQQGAATPTPTPSPTPPANDGIPDEGAVLHAADFTTWPLVTTRSGDAAYAAGGEYHVHTFRGGGVYAFDDGRFGDASYSVAVRRDAPSRDATACLVIRAERHPTAATLPLRSYDLCVLFEGDAASRVVASYKELAGAGEATELRSTELGAFALNGVSASEWTLLTVIARGNQFWFLANGIPVGSAHDGRAADGLIGLAGSSSDLEGTATVSFRDLVVKSIN